MSSQGTLSQAVRAALRAPKAMTATICCGLGAVAVPAWGQVQPGAQEESSTEVITVTGSRIRRDTFNSPSPVQVITREEVTSAGFSSTTEALQGTGVTTGGGADQQRVRRFRHRRRAGREHAVAARAWARPHVGADQRPTRRALRYPRRRRLGGLERAAECDHRPHRSAQGRRLFDLRLGRDRRSRERRHARRRRGLDVRGAIQRSARRRRRAGRISAVGGLSGERWTFGGSLEFYDRSEITLADRDWTQCNVDGCAIP